MSENTDNSIEVGNCPTCGSTVQRIHAKYESEVGIKPHSDGVIYRKINFSRPAPKVEALEFVSLLTPDEEIDFHKQLIAKSGEYGHGHNHEFEKVFDDLVETINQRTAVHCAQTDR